MRALWGWILVYVLGLVVLQLLVYRYLGGEGGAFAEADSAIARRGGSGDESAEREMAHDRTAAASLSPAMSAATTEAFRKSATERICPHCGVENEADTTFTFCRNCAQRLG
ncbi:MULTISPECIES: DUF7577 domain-containing protein [Haloprofundus]|uniref:DUF7577 domain-containing protein n=1 Tax=Haloprofundus TaxID=1911573 RepID=UPI000E453887|nr:MULTISPECIES: hypothetical protein [Haloprofundus]QCJ45779.1 hypothetical protein FCF25_01005 [Haloprofundus sp. MHR1]